MSGFEIRRRNGDVYTVLVDGEDMERVRAAGPWCVRPRGARVYVQYCTSRRGRQSLHRFILGAPSNLQVDHVNGDGLDNRKANLRLVTNKEQAQNLRKQRNVSSRYRGVCWYKSRQKWLAMIRVDGQQRHLGYFDSEDAAGRAARAARDQFFTHSVESRHPVPTEAPHVR